MNSRPSDHELRQPRTENLSLKAAGTASRTPIVFLRSMATCPSMRQQDPSARPFLAAEQPRDSLVCLQDNNGPKS